MTRPTREEVEERVIVLEDLSKAKVLRGLGQTFENIALLIRRLAALVPCEGCGGEMKVRINDYSGLGFGRMFEEWTTCPDCQGTGKAFPEVTDD